MPKTPLRKFSIWRLKLDRSFADAISSKAPNVSPVDFKIESNLARLYTRQSVAKAPDWASFLRNHPSLQQIALQVQSASALLLIDTSVRKFAITFGAARHWIDKEAFDRRFGMMATLNSVDENSLRSLDREEFEAMQRKTRTQTSTRSDIGQFGMDVQRDLLRSVTGTPIDTSLATQMTGADALTATLRVELADFPEKLIEINKAADSENYKSKGYDWIDYFHRITDPEVIRNINNQLISDIKNKNLEGIFLSNPGSVDYEDHIGYLYPGERQNSTEKHADLSIEDYVEKIDLEKITIDKIKSDSIRHYREKEDIPSDSFSVYRAIVYEMKDGKHLYALTGAELFRIDGNHVDAVENELKTIPLSTMTLPNAKSTETETIYNKRVCSESGGVYQLLDRDTVSYGGSRSRIEVCDIFTDKKQFIHVKPKLKSSTLSHLFNQGLVSAQCFTDSRYRKAAAQKCTPPHSTYFDGTPKAEDFEVIFAIIAKGTTDIRDALPFFSKQSLVNAAAAIKGLGHPMSITRVSIV